MSLNDIVVGDYGQPIVLTIVDTDTNAAANVSAYTTAQQMLLRDPLGNISTKAASFVTDGSDGEITYTPVAGDFDEGGEWRVRARVTTAVARLTSLWLEFTVEE